MLKRLQAAVPLRVSLVAATLVLAACGLAVSGIAVTSILRNSQIHRVDRNLVDATRGWALAARAMSPGRQSPTADRPPSNYYLRSISPDGHTWSVVNDSRAEPALPANNDVGPVPRTVGSVDQSGTKWRAVSVRSPHGRLITVAYDLSDFLQTDRSLAWLQLGIGAAVLLVLGLASHAVVSQSLRPLAQIQTAVALSQSSAELARRSEERMRRFITDASHELRTPLTTMRGFAELYRQGAARDMEIVMSRIESESRRMGLLVDDLLLLARLDAQRPIERNRVDLLALASDAVHDAQAIAPNRKITIDVMDGPGTPEVLGDEARLRQVLGNLVNNALQHTPETADVIVRVGTDIDDAVLEVVDEGPGMSQQDALRVFERFYRTDSSRARISGGSGLGLSIVDSLVQAHGGNVTVTTALGQGCRFYVTLPRIADVPARAASARR